VLARDWFERALVLNPSYTEARLNLMVTLNDLGEYSEARKLYGQLRKGGPQRDGADAFAKGKIANMHAELSQAYSDVGMQTDAIGELEKAVALCPSFVDLRTRLGVLYRDAGDRDQALRHFETAQRDSPDYLQARLMLGVLYLSEGSRDDAEKQFEAVLERDPENTSAKMYLRVARAQVAVSDAPPPPD
jgi:tetratricopeptide (TPR) repeat protein